HARADLGRCRNPGPDQNGRAEMGRGDVGATPRRFAGARLFAEGGQGHRRRLSQTARSGAGADRRRRQTADGRWKIAQCRLDAMKTGPADDAGPDSFHSAACFMADTWSWPLFTLTKACSI